MPTDALQRHADPFDALQTVRLVEEAMVQRGLRQLRHLVKEPEGRRVVDEVALHTVNALQDLEDVLASWPGRELEVVPPLAPTRRDREEVLRSFVDLKETEAVALRRAAAAAPPEVRERIEKLAERAETDARRLAGLSV